MTEAIDGFEISFNSRSLCNMNITENEFHNATLYYRRYVDDVFAVFKDKEETESFLNDLNSFQKNIQLTIETEERTACLSMNCNVSLVLIVFFWPGSLGLKKLIQIKK